MCPTLPTFPARKYRRAAIQPWCQRPCLPCLAAWEKFLHESALPPLVTIALAHYQFEAIHPFLDGNGRVGRLLITLFLIERKILPTPLLYLSEFFAASRRDYYDGLPGIRLLAEWQKKASGEANNNPLRVVELLGANPFIAVGFVEHGNRRNRRSDRRSPHHLGPRLQTRNWQGW
jgi:cell filamentation protein, protein adenylyltransferase